MKERPILFSAPMVRAVLAGRKTQTRRLVTSLAGMGPVTEFHATTTPGYDFIMRDRRSLWNDLRRADVLARCPYGAPGDQLWVRENWQEVPTQDGDGPIGLVAHYQATDPTPNRYRWRPSIHMPRRLCRLTLRVESVGVERLQDISEDDALAEGIGQVYAVEPGTAVQNFSMLWDSINSERAPWGSNPWVWVVEFRRVP